MSKNFFDQQEEDFRDVPDEVSGKDAIEILQDQPVGPVAPRRAPATRPVSNDLIEDTEEYDLTEELEEEEEDYSSVLSDARLRLEQGRLYETIMNHELFDGMDADPAAVKHVQRQIRKFAKEQMEIMLGMRRETAKVERLEIDFPFNEVEVRVLRLLADKASGGASKESDRYVPAITRTTEDVPLVENKPKRTGLNPIVGKKPIPRNEPKILMSNPPQAARQADKQPLKRTAAAPVERKAKTNTPDSIVVDGELITRDQIDSQYNPEHKPLQKPVHEMSTDELLAHNKRSQERLQRRVKNPSALPMPSYEQEAMLHQSRLIENSGTNNAVPLIMNLINNQSKK